VQRSVQRAGPAGFGKGKVRLLQELGTNNKSSGTHLWQAAPSSQSSPSEMPSPVGNLPLQPVALGGLGGLGGLRACGLRGHWGHAGRDSIRLVARPIGIFHLPRTVGLYRRPVVAPLVPVPSLLSSRET
jgi:hypothetical protein